MSFKISLGNDIVNICRIEKVYSRFKEKFLNRIFTKNEQIIASKIKCPKKQISFYAKRFAAKEAFSKALGTGFRNGITFIDIDISNDHLGKPIISTNKKIAHLVKDSEIILSLSDDHPFALATVIISKKSFK